MVRLIFRLSHLMPPKEWIPPGPRNRMRWRTIALVGTVAGVMAHASPGLAQEAAGGDSQPQIDANASDPMRDWASLLKDLTASQERRDLIGHLGALIKQGDVAQAKRLLSTAIEEGTLAIILADSMDNPALQTQLKAMAAETEAQPAPVEPPPSANAAMADPRIGELEAAVESQRRRADAALQELSAARQDLASSKANEARIAELSASAAQERARAEEALAELTALRQQQSALQAAAADAAENRDALARERERATALAHDLDAAKEQLASLAPLQDQADELKSSLAQEKHRADAAAQDLQNAQQRLAALTAGEAETGKLSDALDREKDKSALALSQLKSAQEQLESLRARANQANDLEEALKREKERTFLSTRRAETLEQQVAALKARETEAGETTASLGREKQRAEEALQQLAMLHQTNFALEADRTDVRNALAQEKERTAAAARERDAALKRVSALTEDAARHENTLNQEARNAARLRDALNRASERIAALENQAVFTPGALILQIPLTLPEIQLLPPGNDMGRGARVDTESGSASRKTRDVAPGSKTGALSEPSDPGARAQPRERKPVTTRENPGAHKPVAGIRNQNATPARKTAAKTTRTPHPLAQETSQDPAPEAPNLPAALLPDARLWHFD